MWILEICMVMSHVISAIQMCWFVTIDVLGGAIETEPSTEQGHSTRGTGRWFPPPSSITWVSEVNLLQMIYCCVIWNAKQSRMIIRVLRRIYYCIVLNVNCHECLYEYCEGVIVVLYKMWNWYEYLYDYYEGSIAILYWTLTIMSSCMSTTKDLLLYYIECKLSRMFIWILRRSYCCVIQNAKLLRIFLWVLRRIYYCIVLNINYHE
jgi:hypothetical protein